MLETLFSFFFKKKPHNPILPPCRLRVMNVWCHGSFFSVGLLPFLLRKLGWTLSLKSYLYGALGCEAGKVFYRVYCILLLYSKLPKAMELYNPLSNKAMNNGQA